MATAINKSMQVYLSDVMECPICSETLKNARMLPCAHSFCLHCLQTYGKGKAAGNDIDCPMCRKSFKIPSTGFQELPVNFVINKLLDVSKLSDTEAENKPGGASELCDICLRVKCHSVAVKFCLNCEEKLCHDCSEKHKVQKSSDFHQIMALDQKPTVEELQKMRANYCAEHSQGKIEYYCLDCKKTGCAVCVVVDHKLHKYETIKESSQKLSKLIDESSEKLNVFTETILNNIEQIDGIQGELQTQIITAGFEMNRSYKMLKERLKSAFEQEMSKLNTIKDSQLQELQTLKEENEQELVMMHSFTSYWDEVKSKESQLEIVELGESLLMGANELIQSYEKKPQRNAVNRKRIKFTQCDVEFLGIGEICIEDSEGDTNQLASDSDSCGGRADDCVKGPCYEEKEEKDVDDSSEDDSDSDDEDDNHDFIVTCYQCGRRGHISRDCSQHEAVSLQPANIVICYTCGEVGHTTRRCALCECYKCHELGHISYDCPN